MAMGVACLWAVLALIPLAAAGSESVIQEDKPAAPPPPSTVDLDRLLRLPTSYDKPVESKGGVSLDEWEARFDKVQRDLDEANQGLAAAQKKLENTASDGSQWKMSAPGASANTENSPVSFKLRHEIRRQREAVERYERALRELEVEADLAGVPVEWRQEHAGPPSPSSRSKVD